MILSVKTINFLGSFVKIAEDSENLEETQALSLALELSKTDPQKPYILFHENMAHALVLNGVCWFSETPFRNKKRQPQTEKKTEGQFYLLYEEDEEDLEDKGFSEWSKGQPNFGSFKTTVEQACEYLLMNNIGGYKILNSEGKTIGTIYLKHNRLHLLDARKNQEKPEHILLYKILMIPLEEIED